MTGPRLTHDVACVLELFETDPARAYDLDALARAARVSRRTLQKHFRRALGTTPLAALREIRLARARRALLQDRADTPVTEIALRCGFTHFGRFAAAYRARYGEAPSATRQRHRDHLVAAPRAIAGAPERPTLAVLAVEAVGETGRLARGLYEELVTSLARTQAVALTAPGHARYHLTGAVRADGPRSRLTLRLLEARTGRLLWADRQDGTLDDTFGLEERAAAAIARALEPTIRAAEIARAQAADIDRLSAYALTMRALPAAMDLEPAADAMALDLLDRAMKLAPDYARPVALAAWCHAQRAAHHFTASPTQALAEARALADRASRLDRGDALTLTILSGAWTLSHDLDTADALIERALALDAGSPWAWARSGWIRSYRGEAEEARERFLIALELGPADPMVFLNHIGLASTCFHQGRYVEAARWFTRGLAEHPQAVWSNRFRAAALMLSGRRDEARLSLGALMHAFPDLTVAQVRRGLPFNAAYLDRVCEGLESAGMPLG
jgi:AraC-like DNA-binding protein